MMVEFIAPRDFEWNGKIVGKDGDDLLVLATDGEIVRLSRVPDAADESRHYPLD